MRKKPGRSFRCWKEMRNYKEQRRTGSGTEQIPSSFPRRGSSSCQGSAALLEQGVRRWVPSVRGAPVQGCAMRHRELRADALEAAGREEEVCAALLSEGLLECLVGALQTWYPRWTRPRVWDPAGWWRLLPCVSSGSLAAVPPVLGARGRCSGARGPGAVGAA